MYKRIIAILSLITLIFTLTPQMDFAMTDLEYAYIYVAPDGDDTAAGTIDAPLATLGGARDKVRELKASGAIPSKGVVVYLRGGDYNIQQGTVFTEEDSGKADAPIVYRSYPGETAVLVGGASMNASDFKPVTDKSVLDRIIEESVRSQIVSINLKQQGFHDLGDVYLDGSYSYNSNLGLNAPSARAPEFFVDGKLMTNARYPNNGYMTVSQVVRDGYSQLGLPGATGNGDPLAGIEIKSSDKRYLNWTRAEDAVLFGYWYYDWADQSMPVKSINVGNESIVTSISSLYGTKANQRFFAYNLLEEIDIPGEYYIDRSHGILYLYPPKPMDQVKEVKLSLLEEDVITVGDGAEYIDFKNIKFTAIRKSAVVMNKCSNINVIGCEVEYTADRAIQIWDEARNCSVKNCYIHDVNGGIRLRGGIYDNLEPGNNIAENNHIERFSRLTKTYTGAIEIGAVGNVARYNEIHDGPHLGVFFYGNDNRVEYNNIYNVVKETDDAGAIYGGQTWVGRGLQLRYNYIHDIRSESGQGVGRAAVYLDGGQCDVTMMGNILDNIEGSGFWLNGGQDNNVYNNIMLNIDDGAVYFTDIMATGIIPLEQMQSGPERYAWLEPEKEPWKNEIWRERYPEMLPQLESGSQALLPLNCMMHNNLIMNSKAVKYYGGAASYLDMDNNWIAKADPGFYDIANKNYLLKPDSDVFEEIPGFTALPFTRMGRYDERALQRVKDAVALQIGSPYARAMDKDTMIDTENMLVVPVIEDSKTLVPVRFISEAVGADVEYNPDTKGIRILSGANTLELTLNSLEAKKNGESVTLTKAPTAKEGRTLLPLRDVSELLGKEVFWDNSGLIVISDNAELFSETSDKEIISYLHEYLTIQ